MYMRNWIAKLDDFMKLSGRNILDHAGSISNQEALEKARTEYEKYRAKHLNDPSPVEKHFQKAVEEVKKISEPRNTLKTRKEDKKYD